MAAPTIAPMLNPVTLLGSQSNGVATKVLVNSDGAVITAAAAGSGEAVTIADGADVTLGAKADAKSTATDTTPITAMSVWKQISASVQLMVFGAGTAAAAQRVTLASDGPGVAALGATTDAKVVTDANGSIIAFLRGLVTFFANALGAGTEAAAIRVTLPTDGTGVVNVKTAVQTITTAITRPSDGNAYAANDAFANSTSSPTAGGFTFTSAARASGGSGKILDAVVSASASSAYIGEIWIFDQAVTATNDNAALSVADSDILFLVGVIPFNTSDVNSANAISYITGLNIGYTCVGTANLRFLVKIMSAVTPASAEVLNIRIKVEN